MNNTNKRNIRRKRRVSSNIRGTEERPRIVIHRTNKFIYAQAIDDVARVTIVAASSMKSEKATKSDQARQVGVELGKSLIAKKIKAGVYDRNRFTYNGRVKALAEGLREAGLQI
ncbi:50S ribosomal protein L18 [Candidatus Roizmanbacteria bacterium]|nr:50S ribosomal protein L18 [Candidatus Roizmanbacteria bacterium]